MANVIINDASLHDIADAIRSKNGTENTYKPSQMAEAIEAISGGGITPTGTIQITANGTHNVTNYASAEVNVPTGSEPSLGTKSITTNGTYTASDDSLDGYSEVTVNVPTGITPTGTKQISITTNGTTTEDVSAYASAEIAVNVPSSGGGYLPLLDTIVINNNTRTYNLDLTPYSSYGMVLVVFDTVELSASDYLYFVRNGTEATGGVYTAQKQTFSGLAMVWGTWISPNRRMNAIGGSTTLQINNSELTNVFIYCYTASTNIKAGSTIKIYGG